MTERSDTAGDIPAARAMIADIIQRGDKQTMLLLTLAVMEPGLTFEEVLSQHGDARSWQEYQE